MFKRISYAFGLIFFIIFAFLILKNANLNNFIDTIENRTFDLRQSILINEGTKKANQDIVIVAIDDATYEYILDNFQLLEITIHPICLLTLFLNSF